VSGCGIALLLRELNVDLDSCTSGSSILRDEATNVLQFHSCSRPPPALSVFEHRNECLRKESTLIGVDEMGFTGLQTPIFSQSTDLQESEEGLTTL
jgi:hypothetical protein